MFVLFDRANTWSFYAKRIKICPKVYRKTEKISFFCDRNIIYFVELWAIPFFYLLNCVLLPLFLFILLNCDLFPLFSPHQLCVTSWKLTAKPKNTRPYLFWFSPVLNIKEYFRVIPFLCKGILGTCGLKIGWIAWPSFFFDTWCLVSNLKGETSHSHEVFHPNPF